MVCAVIRSLAGSVNCVLDQVAAMIGTDRESNLAVIMLALPLSHGLLTLSISKVSININSI